MLSGRVIRSPLPIMVKWKLFRSLPAARASLISAVSPLATGPAVVAAVGRAAAVVLVGAVVAVGATVLGGGGTVAEGIRGVGVGFSPPQAVRLPSSSIPTRAADF